MSDKFKSRRWLLASFFALTSTIAFFIGILEPGLYVSVITIILGLYAGLDTTQQVLEHKITEENDK